MRMQVRSLASLSGLGDLALPQAIVQVADMAWIWRCCGWGISRQLELRFDPLAWELPHAEGAALKRKKKSIELYIQKKS